jgi:hypothetical protein
MNIAFTLWDNHAANPLIFAVTNDLPIIEFFTGQIEMFIE